MNSNKSIVVLITGIGGLIGSNFAHHLINNYPQYEIIGIDDLSGGYSDFIPKSNKVTFYELDLQKTTDVSAIFQKHQIDYIYHFAAYAAEGLSPFIRVFNYSTNLITTTHLINLAIKHKIKRFVFTSSMAVYGRGNDNPPFTEETDRKPIDPYGVAKMACEMDLELAGEQHNLDWCIIRPHNVYGKYQNIWDTYRNVIGIWMYKLYNKQPITVYGDGLQERAFSYIDDIMEPLVKAGFDSRASKQIVNLGGVKSTKLIDLANQLKDIVGYGEIVHLEPRHEVKLAFPSHQKSIKILDFQDKTDLSTGLKLMWEWVQKQPNRPQTKWDNYELDVGIYSYWSLEEKKEEKN